MSQACEKCKKETIINEHDVCPNCCVHEFDPDNGNFCTYCGEDGGPDMDALEGR